MMNRRVLVTGMGAITPLGDEWQTIKNNLENRQSGVSRVPELDSISGMACSMGAIVPDFQVPPHYSRKKMRTVGRVAAMAIRASEMALKDAGLLDSHRLVDGRTGVSYGSTYGSAHDSITFMEQVGVKKNLDLINGSTFIRFMGHTCAANISQFFQTRGRIIPASSACTSGSQGIGFGYESIASGAQDIMIAGGAEEFHPVGTAVFDIMYATSTRKDIPATTPRPFDRDRDGLVVGEGAATLVLESEQSAVTRGAPILGELVSFGTNSDGMHMVNPSEDGMQRVMELALDTGGIAADAVDYVSAHGTSTDIGDVAESRATAACFKRRIPISSLKSFLGHSLGACGAIEAFIAIHGMNDNWIPPTLNLDNIDPRCGDLDYVTTSRSCEQHIVMSNNFAFGGVNTSLIFRTWDR